MSPPAEYLVLEKAKETLQRKLEAAQEALSHAAVKEQELRMIIVKREEDISHSKKENVELNKSLSEKEKRLQEEKRRNEVRPCAAHVAGAVDSPLSAFNRN